MMSSERRGGTPAVSGGIVGCLLTNMERGEALALCRIGIVSVLTASLLAHLGAVTSYFSDASPLFGAWARTAFPSRWSLFFHLSSPEWVRTVFVIGALAHVGWVLGAWTRICSVVSVVLWVSMMGRNPLLYGFPDQLGLVLAVLLAFMPTGRAWSVDAWRRRRAAHAGSAEIPVLVPVWCRHLLQLQLVVVYGATGLLKTGDTWRESGTAIYYTMVNPLNRHFDFAEGLSAIQPWVLRPLTFSVLVWEVGFAGFVALLWARTVYGPRRWLPDLRLGFLGFGVCMHVGIQLTVYVVFFSALMLCAYACFVTPDEARSMLKRLRAMVVRDRSRELSQ